MKALLLWVSAVLCLLAPSSGQGQLTTTYAYNSGGANGGVVYFDLDVTEPAGIQVNMLDIHTGSPSGGVTVYTTPITWVGNSSNMAAWTSQAVGSFATGSGLGSPTQVCLGGGFYLQQGQHGIAVAQDATTWQAYTTGTGGVPLVYSTSELTLTAGGASNTQFVGAVFQPRVWNGSIYYNVGPGPGACIPTASKEVYGVGCIASYASLYEAMTSPAFDLTNTDILGTHTGSGYSVQASAGTGPLAVGGIGATTVLTLGDDDQIAVGTLGMSVGSNGWLAMGAGNSNAFTPSAATMLSNPAAAIYVWTDLQPNTSGVVTYEEDVASGQVRVTYDGVNGWNTPDPVFVQIDYNVNTGNWAIRFGTVGFANPEDWLIGYSPAGASADPGSSDLSAGTITTSTADLLPLAVDSNDPGIGTNWVVTTSNIDALSPFAVTFFGARGAATPMSLIGLDAPGCDIHLAALLGSITSASAGGAAMVSVSIPYNPALAGQQIAAQSVCLTLQNAANLLVSNGLEGTLGL